MGYKSLSPFDVISIALDITDMQAALPGVIYISSKLFWKYSFLYYSSINCTHLPTKLMMSLFLIVE